MATRANAPKRSASPLPVPARARSGRRKPSDVERSQARGRAAGGERADEGGEEQALARATPARSLTRRQRLTGTLEDAGEAVRGAGSAVTGVVVENPVPVALIGAGLAWLLLGGASAASPSARRPRPRRATCSNEPAGASKASRNASRVASVRPPAPWGESLSSAADAVRNGASRIWASTRKAPGRRVKVRDGAMVVGEQARRGYDLSRRGVSEAWQQHPLTSGLGLLAAGLAVGHAAPRDAPRGHRHGQPVRRRYPTREGCGPVAGRARPQGRLQRRRRVAGRRPSAGLGVRAGRPQGPADRRARAAGDRRGRQARTPRPRSAC
jgi:hypothetical protein